MKLKKLLFPIFLTTTLLFVVGCSSEASKIQEKDVDVVKTVLENNFNGPEEEVREMMNDVNIEGIVQYEEELFKDYFASDELYKEYTSTYGSLLWIEPVRNNYELNVTDIEVESTESEDNVYDFTMKIEYKNIDGDSSGEETITGQADLNEDHLLEYMLIRVDKLMTELSQPNM